MRCGDGGGPEWFRSNGYLTVKLQACAMSDSRLLWVNTDAKSYRGCKRVTATQASAINAQAQAQARAARNQSKSTRTEGVIQRHCNCRLQQMEDRSR